MLFLIFILKYKKPLFGYNHKKHEKDFFMKNTFAFILDVLFVLLISFILFLVLFTFFTPYPYSLIFSACIAIIISLFYFARYDKRNKKAKLSKENKKRQTLLISELNFSTTQEQNFIMENALFKAGLTVEKKRGALLLKDKDALILMRFSFNKITKAEIVKAFNLISKRQTVYILAESFDEDIISFAKRFDGRVVLIDGEKVFCYLKEHNAMPLNYKYQCFLEKRKKGSFKNLLDKRKAKTFFIFGMLFLISSYISPLKTYYIVCGCLFLIYSLTLRVLGKDLNLNIGAVDKT